MQRAYAQFRLPSGASVRLSPGDIIGRHRNAALCLDDPRISEMHAYVSLRSGGLCLLALRGGLRMSGLPAQEARIEPGLRVAVAPDLELLVEHVELPPRVLGVAGLGRQVEVLQAPINSLIDDKGPTLVPSWIPTGLAWIWSDGEGWRARVGTQPIVELGEGSVLQAGTHRLSFVSLAADTASDQATLTREGLFPPMRIVTRYDTVHIHRDKWPVVSLSGFPARIVSELAAVAAPLHWSALAGQLWRREDDAIALRQRLDRNLVTLRGKLREGQVRPNLVRADGKGHYELLLLPGDELIDES
ncbi:MAG: FHA domain-containing protein [Oligoflexia bacterium]|nr:FHA domain-containing protein [Oligoflexia bacterium]